MSDIKWGKGLRRPSVDVIQVRRNPVPAMEYSPAEAVRLEFVLKDQAVGSTSSLIRCRITKPRRGWSSSGISGASPSSWRTAMGMRGG